ncbi:MAG: helix-turn-helix domain-containing protein [Nitrococcus sp.]|nr:helix-turn-helix domain-containing protein [Nitrococcus sp.]
MTPAEITTFRARHGLTRAALARLLPVSYRTLEYWERGQIHPPRYLHRALRDIEAGLTQAAAEVTAHGRQ